MRQRTAVLIILILVVGFGAALLRLSFLTMIQGSELQEKAVDQQLNDTVLTAKRGSIYDSQGTVLAESASVWQVVLAPIMFETDKQREFCARELSQIFNLEYDNVLEKTKQKNYYTVVKRKIEVEQRDKVMELIDKLAEDYDCGGVIQILDDYKRYYPRDTLASAVIGFAGADEQGLEGVEYKYDDYLSGTPGRIITAKNARGTNMPFQFEQNIESEDGNNVYLTIDENIQSICEKYLNELNEEFRNRRHKGNGFNNGACIIMDVNTGGILAMASSPGFDLSDPYNISAVAGMPKLDENYNPISSYMSEADTQALSDADKSKYLSTLWSNYCISSHFEPGSTAKPFTTATGLETGKIKPTDKYECNGYLQVGDTYIRCVHVAGDGILDPGGAIERSCNVALMQEAEKIGADLFCKYQNVFNFGLKTNVDLAREARTNEFLYTSDQMSDVDLASNSFGQNFECTMIQMISGFCSLINGGSYYQPHIVDRITSAGGSTVLTNSPRLLKKTVSEETSAMIRKYCIRVVEGENGTGPQARPAGYRVGGKTGTAETLPRENGQYIVSFLGFAPAENPRIAIYVVLDRMNKKNQDESLWASATARKILTEVLPYMNIYMTEPLTDAERIELEKQGLYDTNDRKNDRTKDKKNAER